MSCLMRATLKPPGLEIFFFLPPSSFLCVCVSVAHWLQLLGSATNFLVRELWDNLPVASAHSAGLNNEDAGNVQPLLWGQNQQQFHFRNLMLARQREAKKKKKKILLAKWLEIRERNQNLTSHFTAIQKQTLRSSFDVLAICNISQQLNRCFWVIFRK